MPIFPAKRIKGVGQGHTAPSDMIIGTLLSKLESLSEHLKEYITGRIDQLKLNLAGKVATLASDLITGVVLTMIFFLFLLFGSIAAAYAIAKWTGETYLGFLIIAVFYILVGAIIWMSRERIKKQILDAIVQKIYREDDPSEN